MTGPTPYLFFPGNAEEALRFYQSVFGGDLTLASYADFQRSDGPGDAIAHGELTGLVHLCGSDAAGDEDSVNLTGMALALLGTSDPQTLSEWYAKLADGGVMNDALQERPWGAHDGQVTDRYGIRWLIGYEG